MENSQVRKGLVLAAIILLTSPGFPFPPASQPPPADAYDFLYLAPARPYWFRLHVRVGGRPYPELWERALDTLFANLDANGDGFLSPAEARRVPHSVALNQVMQSGYPLLRQFNAPAFAELDADGDGKVSRAELGAYYRKGNPPLLRVQPQFNPDVYAEHVTRTIFKMLDRDGDGRLTEAEACAAEALLEKFDANDDECLSVSELIPDLLLDPAAPRPRPPMGVVLLFFRAGDAPRDLAQRLLKAYDHDKDYHLDRKEIALDDDAFAALDRDGSGKLDVPELTDFFQNGLPDLEAEVTLDTKAGASVTKLLGRRASVPLRDSSPGRVAVKADKLVLSVGESSAPVVNRAGGPVRDGHRRGFTQLFMQAAAGKSYVEAQDLESPSFQALRPFFPLADRDGDGKLTMQEFTAFLELQFQFVDASLAVSFYGLVPNWFVLLDANRDGRLSRRELRDAWKTLSAKYPVINGGIERPDWTEEVNIALVRGPQPGVPALTYLNPPPPPDLTHGPLWFRKMDRNRDGYVSRREFLGTKEDFDRIDTDHDGLIDADEAERATPRRK